MSVKNISLYFQLALETAFFGICLYINSYFKVLRKMIHEEDLKIFVEKHQEILSLTQKFKKTFWPIIFVHYTIIFFFLCMTAFEVVVVEEIGQKLVALSCTITAIVGIFLFSYGGQILMDSSVAITDEIYNVNKDYIFIIMRTQHAVKLNVGIFNPNLETCKTFMDYTWSFIAFLRYLKKLETGT